MNDQYLNEIEQLLNESSSSVHERERTAFDRQLQACQNQVVLFGAGNFGRKALRCLRGLGVQPLAFADNNEARWNTELDEVPVVSPQEAAARYGQSALFVVCVWSLGHFYPDTYARLTGFGCRHVVEASAMRWKCAQEMLPDFCQDLPHKVYEDAEEVRKAASLWADEYSRQEYLTQLKWRALGQQLGLRRPVPQESYFLDDLYSIVDGEVFVDCGAYDGDTARQVLLRNPTFGRILAIEADPANYRSLQQWIGRLDHNLSSRITALNVAVGASRGQLRFRATGAEGACIAQDGDLTVECVPIDDLASDDVPTFVKMDIEGAELDALAGARDVIAENAPLLSICVYHRQSDLWNIPNFIQSIRNDYKFFLRPHDVDGWQLVCYAVPASRMKLAG